MRPNTYLMVALSICTSLAIGDAEAGFKALNDYLVDKVKDRDVAANLQAAVEFLKELETVKPPIFRLKNPTSDVKLFVSLKQVVDDMKCDEKETQIMLDNRLRGGYKERRVNLVMQDIFEQHAKKCFEVYLNRFNAIKDQFGESTFKRVAIIGYQVMEADRSSSTELTAQYFYDTDEIFDRYVQSRFSIADSNYGNQLREALKTNAEGSDNFIYTNKILDERTGAKVLHKDKIKELVGEYLINPCKIYLADFGTNLFIPAKVDAQWHFRKEVASNSEFYLGWAYFYICRSLVDNYTKVTNEIIDSVKHH